MVSQSFLNQPLGSFSRSANSNRTKSLFTISFGIHSNCVIHSVSKPAPLLFLYLLKCGSIWVHSIHASRKSCCFVSSIVHSLALLDRLSCSHKSAREIHAPHLEYTKKLIHFREISGKAFLFYQTIKKSESSVNCELLVLLSLLPGIAHTCQPPT